MLRYSCFRVVESVPLLILLSFLIFTLFKFIPGDYLSEMELDPSVSSRQVEQLRRSYGLDEPLVKQYWLWVTQVLQGNLGYSFAQHRPAAEMILERSFGTLRLAITALFLTLAGALPLAAVAAFRLGSWPDKVILWISLLGLSIPTVLSALLLLYLGYLTGWFPIGGAESWRQAVLPGVTLAVPMAAFFTRTLRLELAEVLRQPYMLAAAARGLSPFRVLRHALRNALNPIISLSGVTLGGLLSGAVVVEKVFGFPGMGALTVDSILTRDLYVALNCVLISALFVIIANLISDVLLAWNDPQIRYQ